MKIKLSTALQIAESAPKFNLVFKGPIVDSGAVEVHLNPFEEAKFNRLIAKHDLGIDDLILKLVA